MFSSQSKILLVDDDRGSRLALRAILEDLAHGLVEASSGEEALQQLAAEEFAVVILDVQMPGLDGFETARHIRNRDRFRHTPIIFLTGYDSDEFPVEDAYSLGAVDYLVKPISPIVLRAKVAEFVQLFQAREDAHRHAQEFRLLVQGTTEYAIFMLDSEGHIRTWNAGAERIKGYKAEEIIGQHFSRFYPQEALDRSWPAEELRRAAADGRLEDEGWRVRKDGSTFWANVMITALRDEEGRLHGFSKVTRDLTERKKAEENERRLLQEQAAREAAEQSAQAARRAERAERIQREQLHVTLRSIGDAVIVTDRHGQVTFMNPVAEALTGWRSEDAAGQSLDQIFRIVNEETRLPVESPVTKVLREGIIVGLANHTVLIAKDGKEIPIDDSGAPIRDREGIIEGVVLVFRDVTEARRAVEVRLNLAAIVESSNDAIIGKNLEGIVTSWNQGAERLFGYTAGEIVGKSLSILVPPEQQDELPSIMQRLKLGETIEHLETVRRCKDGRQVDVSLTISPVRNAYGKLIGASKVARDISERKRAEESLRFLADASAALASIVDYKSTLRKVAKMAVPFFADWCVIDMLQSDGSLHRLEVVHTDRSKVNLLFRMNETHPIRHSDGSAV